jgi:hypothetical protein
MILVGCDADQLRIKVSAGIYFLPPPGRVSHEPVKVETTFTEMMKTSSVISDRFTLSHFHAGTLRSSEGWGTEGKSDHDHLKRNCVLEKFTICVLLRVWICVRLLFQN